MAVLLETTLGDIVFDLKTDLAPKTCLNFLKLCKAKYYNNALVLDVQKDYTTQIGHLDRDCSVYGLIEGDQKRYFEDEFHPQLVHDRVGVVSMANIGPDMSASRFFITLTADGSELNRKHTVFAIVGEGLEVLAKINGAYCDKAGRPYTDIRIKHTYILEDPFDDPPGLLIPQESPEPVRESDRLLEDEILEETCEGDLEASIQAHEAKTRSIVLEMLGDLPDAEIKPPDNVAFVCKLNPVTTDADLYMLFSRFGPVKSCDVIRDWKTGDSLQYGFVEFENPRDCDQAILKMDGLQVDERRIRVDYSQSVAKLWKKYRRGRPERRQEPALQLKETAHDARFKQDRHKLLVSRRRSRS